MNRTVEEQREYDALSPNLKKMYDLRAGNELYSHWTHRKLLNAAVIDEQINRALDNAGVDVTPTDPVIWITILDGAKQTLKGLGIISDAIIKVMDKAISDLTDLAVKGVQWIGDKLNDFWKWLNS